MAAITIASRDRHEPHRTIDLFDILQVISEPAITSDWQCSNVECIGSGAEHLQQLADYGQRISGGMFVQIAATITQTWDGSFHAFRTPEEAPWLVIRAVDGIEFDVECHDERIIAMVKASFPDARDVPDSAGSDR